MPIQIKHTQLTKIINYAGIKFEKNLNNFSNFNNYNNYKIEQFRTKYIDSNHLKI